MLKLLKPCRSGLRTGWVTYREYRREGHTLFFLFFFFFFAYCVVLCLNVYGRAHLALFRRPDVEKNKIKVQIWQCSSHEN